MLSKSLSHPVQAPYPLASAQHYLRYHLFPAEIGHAPTDLMGISTARQLAEATSCWLHQEYLCQRAGLFDEAALKGAVGQLLSSFVLDHPARAWSSVLHPALAQYAKSQGSKPRFDFALAELDGNKMGRLRIAVETKWADSDHCTPANIAYDIFRLALLSEMVRSTYGYECECVFLLAGSRPV